MLEDRIVNIDIDIDTIHDTFEVSISMIRLKASLTTLLEAMVFSLRATMTVDAKSCDLDRFPHPAYACNHPRSL
jgi:hypothetical protein